MSEPLYRVVLVDPLSEEEVRDLGFFRESFARDFVGRYRQRTKGDPNETRIAVATPICPEALGVA